MSFISCLPSSVLFRQAREVYRPVAAEASLMYFMLLKLSTVDSMYQYSLDSFTRWVGVVYSPERLRLGLVSGGGG